MFIKFFVLLLFPESISCIHCSFQIHILDIKNIMTHSRHCSFEARAPNSAFVCLFCEYSTNNGTNMKRHIRRHTGEKPYKCSFCDYSSNRNDNAINHARIVHNVDYAI
uniref:RE1-silencing transcription factor n=1 Tax=Cacopsylla melanoneura TaxID=428564 RepID=A0A8D9E568_9HEMI